MMNERYEMVSEYDQFKPTTFIQNCMYINFRIYLTQFYINFSRQEHPIDVIKLLLNS